MVFKIAAFKRSHASGQRKAQYQIQKFFKTREMFQHSTYYELSNFWMSLGLRSAILAIWSFQIRCYVYLLSTPFKSQNNDNVEVAAGSDEEEEIGRDQEEVVNLNDNFELEDLSCTNAADVIPPTSSFFYSQWLNARNTSALFGLQGDW